MKDKYVVRSTHSNVGGFGYKPRTKNSNSPVERRLSYDLGDTNELFIQEQRWLKAMQMRSIAGSSGSVDKFLTTSPITQDPKLVYCDIYQKGSNKGTLNQNNSYKTFITTNKQRSIEMDLQSFGDATTSMFSEAQPQNTREQMLANFKEISRIMT